MVTKQMLGADSIPKTCDRRVNGSISQRQNVTPQIPLEFRQGRFVVTPMVSLAVVLS